MAVHYLLDKFSKEFPLEINKAIVEQYVMLMYSFETRQKHANALNSPYLGIDPIYFTTQDNNNLFDVLEVDQKQVKNILKTCPSINTSYNVIGNHFNLFTTYALFKTVNSPLLSDEYKEHMSMALLKMLNYKFFTSLINHNFQYGANPTIMKSVVNNLSEKFDLVKYGTWKKVIEARCEDILDSKSIHYKTIHLYNDDKNITYLLSDTQTRLRNKIKIIITEYHQAKARGDMITSNKLDVELDGEKIVIDQVSTFDSMTNGIYNHALNVNQWINNEYIKIITSIFNNINQTLLKQTLVSFSNYISLQARRQQLDRTIRQKDLTIYLGGRIYIKTLLQKIYRNCIQSKVNLKNKVDILVKAKNLFSASRISDKDIIELKESTASIIDECVTIQRESTRATLRIAFICYIMLKSFEYL